MKSTISAVGTILLGAAMILAAPGALAYDQYSQNRNATNCRACHGDFRSSPYTSLSDGQSWGDDLHDVHRSTMLGGDCDVCHLSGRFPVYVDRSTGGLGLAAISCTGCHGRSQDATSGTVGAGAGLRQHHYRAGTTVCVNCHTDSNPAAKTVVGENILPPYYANPGTDHPNMPTDSCNPAPAYTENFKGTTLGLDNDGDGVYDAADSNCGVQAVCGNGTVETGETCDDGNTANGDCCSSTCQFEASGSACNDALFCNVGETCNGSGVCGGGGARDCSDAFACTSDACSEATDQCTHSPNDAACSDGLFCNGAETCSVAAGCVAGTAVSCNDSDICTDDTCNEAQDRCDYVFDPTNDPSCAALVCGNGTLDPGETCDDGNTANGDCCSSTCQLEASGSACDDGLFCNVGETCDGAGLCGGGAPRSCDDGVSCTTDSCSEATDQCVHAPSNAACDDGLFCNGAETCDVASGCLPGTAVDCDDADICTDDACDEAADACDHVFDPTNDPSCAALVCGNGTLDPGETCDDGNTANGDCCSSTCQFEASGSACDDGLFCNVGETCDGAGACGGGSARDCDDGVACTIDSCSDSPGQCVNTPSDAVCDDGLFCNGVETCDLASGCLPGSAVDCDDADICTDDSCNETADRCDNVYDPTNDPSCVETACGNDRVEPGEQCDDGNTSDGDCCSSTCQFEASGSACDDGLFCNAGETCDGAGTCGGGAPQNCDDGVSCTVDSCSEATDQCVHAPNDAACDDGLFCNGAETCDAATGCRTGTALDCDDADICTDDACNETADRCDNIFDPTNDPSCAALVCGNGSLDPGEECDDGNTASGDCCSPTCRLDASGTACDDGLFCNAGETCDGAGTCGGGSARDCDDGIACTTDSCSEATDQCLHAPSDAACDDGLYCNGSESCSPATGCVAGASLSCDDADICTDDACNETADRCDNVFDPTNDPSCAAVVCGNGTLDAGEQCDDGNTANGDCCSSTCRFEASGSACDDGLFCNTGETCDGAGACGGGGTRNCGDGIACTADSCSESTDLCVHAPSDTACDDGLFCNGAEACSPSTGCVAGAAVDCDDGDICTDDACNESADACDHVFDRNNDPSCQAACPDEDDDGYSPAGEGCGPIDCDDSDASVRPGATETCDDDKDNDCDGKIDAADETCGGVPGWSVRGGSLIDPDYAGSVACASCHQAQFETWSGSLHARMMVRPGDAQAAGFPLPEGLGSWNEVLFVLGQKWRSVWVDRSGVTQGTQWNYKLGAWSPHPEQDYDCGACHTTGYDPAVPFEVDGSIVPGVVGAWVEFNIGCEACHGPGADHVASPRKDNINRIALDWTATGEGVVTPSIRSSQVCGNCHFRTNHSSALDSQRRNQGQFNQWSAGPHAASLESTTLSTYCAKCHSPGNATADSEEHYFTYFDPRDATHVACVACHDPHKVSDDRWNTLRWPSNGRRDPVDFPAAVARYRGTDGSPATNDHIAVPSDDTNSLCTGCHVMQPGYRRHVDASPPNVVALYPPFNGGEAFLVPHMEHVEEEQVECVTCHMPYNRTSINRGDVRGHTGLPNELGVGGNIHFSTTCGQCHDDAQDCVWCHGDFARRTAEAPERPVIRPLRERPFPPLQRNRERSP